MKRFRTLLCLAAAAGLCACAGSPPARYFTLDAGDPPTGNSSSAPSVAVVRADVPDLIDRPQVVIHTTGNQVLLSEQIRWAAPLRQQIPRVVASDLGELLHSDRVAVLPVDARRFDVDFKLMLDVQRLDAVAGRGVDVDVLWRIEHRSGKVVIGRSRQHQPVDAAKDDCAALVAAQRMALRRVAVDIAPNLALAQFPSGASGATPTP